MSLSKKLFKLRNYGMITDDEYKELKARIGKGKWVPQTIWKNVSLSLWMCNKCKLIVRNRWAYCPACGRRMFDNGNDVRDQHDEESESR